VSVTGKFEGSTTHQARIYRFQLTAHADGASSSLSGKGAAAATNAKLMHISQNAKANSRRPLWLPVMAVLS
jgi:hypothetical protein